MHSTDNIRDRNIAVIGAGLAGAVFTHRMLSNGYNVTVFDKSRGTGGRHASSRIGNNSADLGSPYFDTATPEFRAWLSAQPELTDWQAVIADFDGLAAESLPLYTATPRQSALTRSLLHGATLVTSTRIKDIWPEADGVIVRDEEGKVRGHFSKVIVATPAPQAAPLLEANPSFARKAASVQTRASWMLIITLNQPSGLAADVLQGKHPVLARAIKESAKPARDVSQRAEVWALEANSEWSELNIDSDPGTVSKTLTGAFQALTDTPLEVAETRIHRWLYARQRSDTNNTHLWSDMSGIGVCGDWLHGTGELTIADSESAWRSANALADHLIGRNCRQLSPNNMVSCAP